MLGCRNLHLSRPDIEALIATPKMVLRPMSWAKELSARDPAYWQYESPVSVVATDMATLEDVRLVMRWRPSIGEKPAVTNFSLLVGGARAYGVDYGPWYKHTNNKAGRGRPLWNQTFRGSHEHLWSDDGEGYAEPLNEVEPIDLEAAWLAFLRRANFSCDFHFVHPLSGPDKTQGTML
jgi:hypothetical protein